MLAAGTVFGQGFQGGLRGSLKDAGGVVPGVEVTLTNEQTNVKRSTVTNERGEYVFANVDPGNYNVKAALQGYKTVDRCGIRIATQQFLTLDLVMEVAAITESVTVTGQAPLIETGNASQGTVLDSAALQTLPAPGRNAFMIGTTVPTVIPSGDTQFNRQQDQTNASLISLGGGPGAATTTRSTACRLRICGTARARTRRSRRSTTKVQVHTYDAEMPHRRRCLQHDAAVGHQQLSWHRLLPDPAALALEEQLFQRQGGPPKPNNPYYLGGGGFGGPIVKNRTFFWFAAENYTDTQTRNASEVMPTAAERAGDFSGLTNAAGQRIVIYDP
jgi:hypothetical protein